MKPEELAAALKERGLKVHTEDDGDLKVSRPGAPGFLAETIHVEDDRALWSWGAPVNGDDLEAVAVLIDTVVSAAPETFKNST